MSEPIQSIAQNNYILQGNVATSAGVVGDGSTQNPIRADETVLWDKGTATWTGDIVVNEAFSNFDRVKVLFGRGYDNAIYNEFAGDAPQWRCQSTIQAGNAILNYTNYTISGGVSAIKNADLRWTLNTSNSITYAGTAYPNTIYKVIGINRKAQ